MDTAILFTEHPTVALEKGADFLASQPVLHNLILSVLHARIANPEPGRYWLATRQATVVGMVIQSPLNFGAILSPMSTSVVEAVAEAIAEVGISLPGVTGDATSAAHFAGQWSEKRRSAVTPFEGIRLYEWLEPCKTPDIAGGLRRALPVERSLILEWARRFSLEIGEPTDDIEVRVDRQLTEGEVWVWDYGGGMSMAVCRGPAEGVVRISGVYTPIDKRNRSYAAACVHALSKHMCNAGFRCVLYTDLANPTSNSIYRRIGYRAVAEGLRYRFVMGFQGGCVRPTIARPIQRGNTK